MQYIYGLMMFFGFLAWSWYAIQSTESMGDDAHPYMRFFGIMMVVGAVLLIWEAVYRKKPDADVKPKAKKSPRKAEQSQLESQEIPDLLSGKDFIFAIIITVIGTYPLYLGYSQLVFNNVGRYPNPNDFSSDLAAQGAGLFVASLVLSRSVRWLRKKTS